MLTVALHTGTAESEGSVSRKTQRHLEDAFRIIFQSTLQLSRGQIRDFFHASDSSSQITPKNKVPEGAATCLHHQGNAEHVTADVLQRQGWKLLLGGEEARREEGGTDRHLNIWEMNQQGRGGYYVSR